MSVLAVAFMAAQALPAVAQCDASDDSLRTAHRIALDAVPSLIFHTSPYLRGGNEDTRTMNHDQTWTLKYAFLNRDEQRPTSIHRDAYQGIGVARHGFNPCLSNPVSVFLFQGAPVVNVSRRLSLNYEWSLGMAFGWNAYDEVTNPDNHVIGSKVTAYIDVDFYLRYVVSRHFDINAGVSLSHFSNGNTSYPNEGLNTGGVRVGLAYYVGRKALPEERVKRVADGFSHGFYTDVVAYGAWRRRGVYIDGSGYLLPNTYAVMGLNVNPMYRFNPWLSAGASLDVNYDRSANLCDNDDDFITAYSGGKVKREFYRQMAVGLSARAEFAMPYFSINFGVGTNFIGNRGDLRGVYEILALKIHVTRRAMLHIGYSLNDFKTPSNLMLGFGWRFGR